MEVSRNITALQVAIILINTMIGVSVLSLPRLTTEIVGSGAVFVTMIGLVFTTIGVLIISLLGRKMKKQSFIHYTESLIGKGLSRLFGFMTVILFLSLTSLVAKEFGVMMTSSLLKDTPIPIAIAFILTIVAITTRNDITTFAYIHFFYVPFIVLPGLLLVILAIPDAEWIRIQPFLGNNPSLSKILEGGRITASFPFVQIGIFVLSMIIPHMSEPKKAIKGSLWGMLGVFIMIISVVAVTVAVFGSNETEESLWPTLSLSRSINLPMEILERLDILFVVFWMITGFTTMYSGYLLTIHLASDLFKLHNHRALSFIALPFFFGFSLIPNDIHQLYKAIEIVGGYGIILTIGYPFLLFIVSLFRKKGSNYAN